MEERTLRYIAGLSEQLHTPLSDGRTLVHKDQPLVIKNRKDYNRLMKSGKYADITPVSTPQGKQKRFKAADAPVAGTIEGNI